MQPGLDLGIIGAGAWGMALAAVGARAGNRVLVWSRRSEVAQRINVGRRHASIPEAVPLEAAVRATTEPAEFAVLDAVIYAAPAQAMRESLGLFAPFIGERVPLIIAAKGMERATGRLLTEVRDEVCAHARPFVLSGPSFALDVIMGRPAAVALAGATLEEAAELAARLSVPAFRIYAGDDLPGVALAGAVKNVLAIACGIAEGRGLGDSARAALTTRAFAELMRFGQAMGGKPLTLTGLAGLGDLILTCSSLQSRNFSFGVRLGRGETAAAVAAQSATVEGVHTARAVVDHARRRKLDLPICETVVDILEGEATVDGAIARLLARPLRIEITE
ncbi:MAG: NAD(P)-dependent glycerol-3-phosphate dehydrogenase [Pseudomonadota bacterium]|nr:NAD(P)-dependent glycerol-3-phosphate dehydrogenase [Pseudomonadota bacterium]